MAKRKPKTAEKRPQPQEAEAQPGTLGFWLDVLEKVPHVGFSIPLAKSELPAEVWDALKAREAYRRQWPSSVIADRLAGGYGLYAKTYNDKLGYSQFVPLTNADGLIEWIEDARLFVIRHGEWLRRNPFATSANGLEYATAVLADSVEWLAFIGGDRVAWTPPVSMIDAQAQLANMVAAVERFKRSASGKLKSRKSRQSKNEERREFTRKLLAQGFGYDQIAARWKLSNPEDDIGGDALRVDLRRAKEKANKSEHVR